MQCFCSVVYKIRKQHCIPQTFELPRSNWQSHYRIFLSSCCYLQVSAFVSKKLLLSSGRRLTCIWLCFNFMTMAAVNVINNYAPLMRHNAFTKIKLRPPFSIFLSSKIFSGECYIITIKLQKVWAKVMKPIRIVNELISRLFGRFCMWLKEEC